MRAIQDMVNWFIHPTITRDSSKLGRTAYWQRSLTRKIGMKSYRTEQQTHTYKIPAVAYLSEGLAEHGPPPFRVRVSKVDVPCRL